MIPRSPFAKLVFLGVIALAGFVGCTREERAGSDEGPTPEVRRLAREKCDEAARVFYRDNTDPDNLRAALALYEEAIDLDPELVDAHVGRGGVYCSGVQFGWFEQTSLEKAEASFERAIELDPTHVPAYKGLILVQDRRQDREAMLRTGERARRAGGPRDEVRKARAWAFILGQMPDLALHLIEPSRSAGQTTDPEAQFQLATALALAGRFKEATREGERFLERFGDDPEIHLWIATAHHCLGDLESARAHYDRAMELGASTNHYLPVMAGLCYEELGLREESRQIWEKAKIVAENRLAIIQDNDLLQCNLGTYRVLLGEPIRPSGATHHLAGAFDHQGRVEDAVRVIDEMESGAVVLRACRRAFGFRDLDAPPYREALERLEAREARLRDQYGPL